MVLVSPKFGDEHSFILSKSFVLLQDPLYLKADTLPPAFICFGRFHIDAISRTGILHDSHLDAVLKTQPLSKRFHNVYLNDRSLKSLNF
jgi:hypothetical protein